MFEVLKHCFSTDVGLTRVNWECIDLQKLSADTTRRRIPVREVFCTTKTPPAAAARPLMTNDKLFPWLGQCGTKVLRACSYWTPLLINQAKFRKYKSMQEVSTFPHVIPFLSEIIKDTSNLLSNKTYLIAPLVFGEIKYRSVRLTTLAISDIFQRRSAAVRFYRSSLGSVRWNLSGLILARSKVRLSQMVQAILNICKVS